MRRAALGIFTAFLLLAGASSAQTEPAPLPERLYLNPGILIGSARMVSLGGAYTGLGDGAEGISSNPAAVAHRSPHERGPWQLSPVFTWMSNYGEYDFDNDGVADKVNMSAQYLGGLQLRVGRLGVGTFMRTNHLGFCLRQEACTLPADRLDVFFFNPSFSLGYAFLDENLVAAVGVNWLAGRITHALSSWRYDGVGAELGLLVRPKRLPFRVGLSGRTPIRAGYSGGPSTLVAGRRLQEGIVSPGVYSFGLSFKVGEGAFSYNDLPPLDAPAPSRALDARNPFSDLFRSRDDTKTGRVLVTMQVDLIQGLSRAVSIGTFLRNEPPAAIADRLSYLPRLGVEGVVLPGRFKLRGGGYLEPSPYLDGEARLHATGGTELFLFRMIDDWSATLTFDLARHYQNIGVSIGTWR